MDIYQCTAQYRTVLHDVYCMRLLPCLLPCVCRCAVQAGRQVLPVCGAGVRCRPASLTPPCSLATVRVLVCGAGQLFPLPEVRGTYLDIDVHVPAPPKEPPQQEELTKQQKPVSIGIWLTSWRPQQQCHTLVGFKSVEHRALLMAGCMYDVPSQAIIETTVTNTLRADTVVYSAASIRMQAYLSRALFFFF